MHSKSDVNCLLPFDFVMIYRHILHWTVTFSKVFTDKYNFNVCLVQGPRREGSNQAKFYVSFVAGLAAGGIASLSVNPFDGMYTQFFLATS